MYVPQASRRRSRSSPHKQDISVAEDGHAGYCSSKLTVPTGQRASRSRSQCRNPTYNDNERIDADPPCRALGVSCFTRQYQGLIYDLGNLIIRVQNFQDTQLELILPGTQLPGKPSKQGRDLAAEGHPQDDRHRHNYSNTSTGVQNVKDLQDPTSSAHDWERTLPKSPCSSDSEQHNIPFTPSASSTSQKDEDLHQESATKAHALPEFDEDSDEDSDAPEDQCSDQPEQHFNRLSGNFPAASDADFRCCPAGSRDSRGPLSDTNHFDTHSTSSRMQVPHGFNHGHGSHGGSGNNGGRRASTQSTRRRHPQGGRYHCVFCHSGRDDETDDCATRKQYVSQLRRHHERHSFFYCTTCFSIFDSLEERNHHTSINVCFSRCVMRNCHNFDQVPAMLGDGSQPCGHGKDSPGRDQWRYLFGLARPGETIPDPEPQQALPAFSITPAETNSPAGQSGSGRSDAMDSVDDIAANSQRQATADRASVITELAMTSRSMFELAQDLKRNVHDFDQGIDRSMQWILDHTRIGLNHLQQLEQSVREQVGARNSHQAMPHRATSQAFGPALDRTRQLSAGQATVTPNSASRPGPILTNVGFTPNMPAMSQPNIQRQRENQPSATEQTTAYSSSMITDFHSRPRATVPTFTDYDPRPDLYTMFTRQAGPSHAQDTRSFHGSDFSSMHDSQG